MTTADYALIISLLSATVALASFVWNVWQKFIYPKPRLKLRFYIAVIIPGDGTAPPWTTYLSLCATNHGPGEIAINTVGITVLGRWPWNKPQFGIVNPIAHILTPTLPSGPLGGGLPKTLKVGETHSLYFPHEAQSFGRDRLGRLGVFDTFDRFHPASRRQIRAVKRGLDKAFDNQPYVSANYRSPGRPARQA